MPDSWGLRVKEDGGERGGGYPFCAIIDCPEGIAVDVLLGLGVKVEGEGGG